MRINARLDVNYEEKIKYILHQTKENFTDTLKKAIDMYHQHIKKTAVSDAQLISKSGFIGCAKGTTNLSTHYKKDLFKHLNKK